MATILITTQIVGIITSPVGVVCQWAAICPHPIAFLHLVTESNPVGPCGRSQEGLCQENVLLC